MKGKITVKKSGKASTVAEQRKGTTKGDSKSSYAPSVPISIYRDLAKELDSAKHQLSVVTAQNSTLHQQNQALRQEIARVIQSVEALQYLLNHPDGTVTSSNRVSSSVSIREGDLSTPTDKTVDKTLLQTERPIVKSADGIANELIAELDRTLSAEIGNPRSSTLESSSSASLQSSDVSSSHAMKKTIVDGPFCDVVPSLLSESDAKIHRDSTIHADQLFTEKPSSPPNLLEMEDEDNGKIMGRGWLTLTLVVVIVTAFSAGFLIALPFIQKNNTSDA